MHHSMVFIEVARAEHGERIRDAVVHGSLIADLRGRQRRSRSRRSRAIERDR
jgi:hypothetical protein